MTGELDMHWSGYGVMKVLPQHLAGVIEEDCENLHQDSNHTLPWYMSGLLLIFWSTHHCHVHRSPVLTWICPLCLHPSDHGVVYYLWVIELLCQWLRTVWMVWCLVNNGLKRCGRKWLWPHLTCYPGIGLQGLWKHMIFSVRIAGVLTEVWTRHLLNTS